MDKILTEHLVELSDSLDKAGKTQCSDVVDGLIKDKSVIKIAQYVGAIGYVLKQNRAMANCIRKKRVANSGPMQEVVLDCLKEYQTGQEYGNNDWTAKYAQVIEDSPENFESSHTDLFNVIAQENDISDHMNRVRKAGKLLEENKVEDSLFKAILADVDQLDTLFKGGDVDHRPFKLAAPRSQRGFWSRLFSPGGSGRGIQKDTELEMDNVLEGISTIAQSAQQIRSSISALQYQAASLGGYPDISSAVSKLSPNDWNKTLQAVQSLQMAIGSAPPDPNLFQLRDLAYGVSSNVGNVYNQIERMQRNMFNLRQRESVKGRTYGPSAAEEFGHLEMALEKLIRNPLDERALFYSQKLHGRLEDSLNMRSTSMGPEFQEWMDTHQGPSQFEPVEPEGISETREQDKTQPLSGNSMEGIGQQLAEMLGPGFTESIINSLEIAARDDRGSTPEAANLLEFLQGLRTPMRPTSGVTDEGINNPEPENINLQGEPAVDPEGLAEDMQGEPVFDPEGLAEDPDFDVVEDMDYDLNNQFGYDYARIRDPRDASSRIDTLIKIADIIDTISPEVAKILDEYIAENSKEDESLFEFPENALILKEDAKSTLKI